MRQTILQFENDPLRCFFADAGDVGQPRDVAALDRFDELERFEAGQHRERELRSNAPDADQPFEQLLLEPRRETIKRDRVFAHVRVDAQRELAAGVADAVERGQRHEHVVPDAADVDRDSVGMFFENPASEIRDHDCAGLPRRSATGAEAGRYVRQLVALPRGGAAAASRRAAGDPCACT